jgi:putative endonuclease
MGGRWTDAFSTRQAARQFPSQPDVSDRLFTLPVLTPSTGSTACTLVSMPYMYILRCVDGTLITGTTWDLSHRMHQRDAGGGTRTTWRHPVTLVHVEWFERMDEAFYRERQVHSWRRSLKDGLIAEGGFGPIDD